MKIAITQPIWRLSSLLENTDELLLQQLTALRTKRAVWQRKKQPKEKKVKDKILWKCNCTLVQSTVEVVLWKVSCGKV